MQYAYIFNYFYFAKQQIMFHKINVFLLLIGFLDIETITYSVCVNLQVSNKKVSNWELMRQNHNSWNIISSIISAYDWRWTKGTQQKIQDILFVDMILLSYSKR